MSPRAQAPTRPPVLTDAGRSWTQDRLKRAEARLAQVIAELDQEHSDPLAQEREQLRAQVNELSTLLRHAVAPADIRDDPTVVELGDEVEVEFPDGSHETLLIVHPFEAGMDEHRSSSESPLAQAILGGRPGDRVTVRAPGGVYSCTIVRRARID